jgi:hypothetical protein
MGLELSPTSVVRISRGNFDPGRFAEVDRMSKHIGSYLVPAIGRLPGLTAYVAGASPSGSMVHVSVWESAAYAQQMSMLKEMIVDARREAEAVGVAFIPIVNYPIAWQV